MTRNSLCPDGGRTQIRRMGKRCISVLTPRAAALRAAAARMTMLTIVSVKAGDQCGEGQGAAACEIRGVCAMCRNEFVRRKRRIDLSKQHGMEVAKSFFAYPVEKQSLCRQYSIMTLA